MKSDPTEISWQPLYELGISVSKIFKGSADLNALELEEMVSPFIFYTIKKILLFVHKQYYYYYLYL